MNLLRTLHRSRFLRGCASLVLGTALAGCGQTDSSTDTRSNWLSPCADDDACQGGLSCLCGVCTRSCDDDLACSGLGGSQCAASDLCTDPGNICVAAGAQPEDSATTDASSPASASISATNTAAATASVTAESTAMMATSSPTGSVQPEDAAALPEPDAAQSDAMTDAGASACDKPGRVYTSRDPAACTTTPECGPLSEGVGNVPFQDECGCGCEPFSVQGQMDSIQAGQCGAGTSVAPLAVDVVAQSVLGSTCFDTPSGVIHSTGEFMAWLDSGGCSELLDVAANFDFDSATLVIAVVADRPELTLLDSAQSLDGTLHLGVQAAAYCGGAAPSVGYLALSVPVVDTPLKISVDTCYDSCSDGGLAVP